MTSSKNSCFVLSVKANGLKFRMELQFILWFMIFTSLSGVSGKNTRWALVLQQKDKVFVSPANTMTTATYRDCAISCHNTGQSILSLSYNIVSGTCNCYSVNYTDGGAHTVESGTLFFMKTYDGPVVEEELDVTTVEQTTTEPASTTPFIPPSPCLELYNQGTTVDGVYNITFESQEFQVYCDMTDGGWTVIQHRNDGTEEFYRTWNDYVNGFGSLTKEFWLGLDKIHLLTKSPKEVKFVLQRTDNKWISLHHGLFSVGDAASNYKLTTSNRISNSPEMCTYTFTYNNNHRFYTYDNDNNYKCAHNRNGGWWYKGCTWININGKYGLYNTMPGFTEHCSGYNNLQKSFMKIK